MAHFGGDINYFAILVIKWQKNKNKNKKVKNKKIKDKTMW